MKGVILAGGEGTRLRPFTYAANKNTALVYDKPLIWFPIRTLIRAGIEDIIIDTDCPEQIGAVISGEKFDANVSIHNRGQPMGQVSALEMMGDLIQGQYLLVMYGDVYLASPIQRPVENNTCSIYVTGRFDTKRISEYGVIELGPNGQILSIEEKPANPRGRHINAGVITFPPDLFDMISKMSKRDQSILVDLAAEYHGLGRLAGMEYHGKLLNGGTPEDLFLAATERRREVLNQSA